MSEDSGRNRRTRSRPRELPAAKRERLGQVEDPQVVLDAALRFLEARQRSIAEVRRRLATAGYRPELIEGAVERLLALGILDDETFTTAWVESRDRARPRGERALRQELRLKGIDGATIDAALLERRPEPGGDRDPDREAGARLLARHASALARVADPRARRQRAYSLLARHGFDSELAADLSRTLVNAAGPDANGWTATE